MGAEETRVMEMRRIVPPLFSVAVAMAIIVAGCGNTADKNVARKNVNEKPKTVTVNKGLSKKEEKNLNERLDKLEKKVGVQDKKSPRATASASAGSGQPEPTQPRAEEQARAAAEAYYQAVAARNWGYTYDHLDSQTRGAYTKQEWFAKNDYLADTGPVTYTIQSVVMDSSAPESVADVTEVLTATDGSTNVRNTYFVYEDSAWKHRFSPEEYDLSPTPRQVQPRRPLQPRLQLAFRPLRRQARFHPLVETSTVIRSKARSRPEIRTNWTATGTVWDASRGNFPCFRLRNVVVRHLAS
jgi:hypothetical protein